MLELYVWKLPIVEVSVGMSYMLELYVCSRICSGIVPSCIAPLNLFHCSIASVLLCMFCIVP